MRAAIWRRNRPGALQQRIARNSFESDIAAVLLLHERSADEIVAKLSAVELEQVIKLVGRSPRLYPPGTLDTLKRRKALVSPPPSDSVPNSISAKKQAERPQHSADRPRWHSPDRPRRKHTRTPSGLGGSPSSIQLGNGAGPPQNAERAWPPRSAWTRTRSEQPE